MKSVVALNLNKSFKQTVFKDLNIEIEAGEKLVLLGPSGCGKSSLMRVLAGIDSEYTGDLKLNYKNPGMVFQEPRLLPWLNVFENACLPLELLPKNQLGNIDPRRASTRWLQAVHLQDHVSKFPSELSGGMRMRLALARAMIPSPEILFLDEPLSALDEHSRNSLQVLIRKVVDEGHLSMLFITHSLPEAIFMADRILVMNRAGNMEFEYLVLEKNRPDEWRYSENFHFHLQELSKKVRSIFKGTDE